MSKIKSLKKILAATVGAATVGAATLAACTTAALNVTDSGIVSAAGEQNYAEALAMSLYFFDSNECGCEVDSNPLTWRGNCHTYDAKAAISNAMNFPSQYRSLVDPDGDGFVDVSGGYHDAGDHIKFNLTNAFAGSSLAMSYYLNEGAYEKAGCEAHLFDIIKKISDYLMKTTFLNSDGSVAAICYNVSDESDHSYWSSPEVQTHDRKTYWMSSSNNNQSICGEMAASLAGAAYVLQNVDSGYAEKCLSYAEAIYKFGMQNSGNETAGMGNMYGTEDGTDELALAQTWLYLNGKESLPTWKPSGDGSYNGSKYDCWYYCWNKVWSGYAPMMYKITGDSSFKQEMELEIGKQGGLSESSYNTNGWGTSRYNCALQMLGLQVAGGDASNSYAKGAKYQMDYILGNNPYNYSFLIGYGSNWPVHIHHRAANPGEGDPQKNPTAKYTNYGMLVGGADSSGYQDHSNQYQYTEPALDYNACFALACAGLVNLYGGDASALKPVIAAAPEIDENHQFGTWYGSSEPTTEPVTEPVTEPDTQPTTGTSSGNQYDVNSDGTVNISDLIVLQRYLIKNYQLGHVWTTEGQELEAIFLGNEQLVLDKFKPDVNLDNKVNAIDCAAEKRCLIYTDFT